VLGSKPTGFDPSTPRFPDIHSCMSCWTMHHTTEGSSIPASRAANKGSFVEQGLHCLAAALMYR
jgi:hypothetical protein